MDEPARQTMMVPIIRRADITVETFRAYWRAVHGPVAARLKGLDFYEQLHLDAGLTSIGAADVEYGEESYDGLAILSFPSVAALDVYRGLGPIMPADEPNAFGFAVRYDVPAGENGLTQIPREIAARPDARAGVLACVRKMVGASDAEFSARMDQIVTAMEGLTDVSGAWVDLPTPRSTARVDAEAVDRYTPDGRQFQAVLRLSTRRPDAVSPRLAKALMQGNSVLSAKIQTIRESHLFVYHDALTLSAVRGTEAAELIVRQNAENQYDISLLKLFAPAGRSIDAMLR
jgi:hypothetical protein